MEKGDRKPYKFESLSDLHRVLGLPKPLHPLISIVNNVDGEWNPEPLPIPFFMNFYKIAYQPTFSGKVRIGQHFYDFDEGGLFFVSPNQLKAIYEENSDHSGYTLLIHPDFIRAYPLGKSIKQYGFFSYSANEALHLSESEKEIIISIFKMIQTEMNSRIDDFSQDVIISQIELLLSYSNRFYKRQFITRKAINNDLLQKLEEVLDNYFNDKKPLNYGLPTVKYLADQLNLSPSYLSDMLRSLIGQNAQQHIHGKLIEKAKEMLSVTNLSVSEIAYQLGFEHSQSFSKLFKVKTKLSPTEFRESFD